METLWISHGGNEKKVMIFEPVNMAGIDKNGHMPTEETNISQEAMTPAQRVRSDWRSIVEKVSYKAVLSNIPFVLFVVALCVLYIGHSHRAIEIQRQINAQNKILKELRWRHMDVKSQLMYVKTETQVIKSAGALGLKPSLMPAYKISPATATKEQTAQRLAKKD